MSALGQTRTLDNVRVTSGARLRPRRFQRVGLKLVFHMVGESGRSDQVQRRGPMQTNPEQPIEAGKMIHVGVRHETMRNAQELAAAAPVGAVRVQCSKLLSAVS
jgi:hypothetical protein